MYAWFLLLIGKEERVHSLTIQCIIGKERNLTAKHMWMITDVESFDIDFIKQSGCSKPRYSSVINSNLCPRYYFMFFIR